MKILIIQENGRHEENRHLKECFCFQREYEKLGDDVDIWGLSHDTYDSFPDFNSYDLILNFENYDETGWVPNLSEYNKPIKFLRSMDAHCIGIGPFIKTYKDGKYDLILQAIKDYVDDNSVWMPNSFDAEYIRPLNMKKEHFIGFCGSILNRAQLLNFLTQKYNLKQDIFVLGDEMVKRINTYKIHFNINLANDINCRSFETIAAGTVLITNYNPQYEKLGFQDGKNCIIYKTIEELVNKLEYYKNNDSELEVIAMAGQKLSIKHTHKKRAITIKELVTECLEKRKSAQV